MSKVYMRFDKSNKFRTWRKRLWYVWGDGEVHRFTNRNAAIMWLKRYGKEKLSYMLEKRRGFRATVRVENGYVYFYNPECGLMITAESKRTHNYAIRNN